MKTLKIRNCYECPFANDDNEWGRYICNLANHIGKEISVNYREGLPEDKVHDECPLKESPYILNV